MLVATLKVHASKGLWAQSGGFEYNLVLVALLAAIGLIDRACTRWIGACRCRGGGRCRLWRPWW